MAWSVPNGLSFSELCPTSHQAPARAQSKPLLSDPLIFAFWGHHKFLGSQVNHLWVFPNHETCLRNILGLMKLPGNQERLGKLYSTLLCSNQCVTYLSPNENTWTHVQPSTPLKWLLSSFSFIISFFFWRWLLPLLQDKKGSGNRN